MQIQIEATDDIVVVDGTPCRVWKGVTAEGVECTVYTRQVLWPASVKPPEGTPLKYAPRLPAMANVKVLSGVLKPANEVHSLS